MKFELTVIPQTGRTYASYLDRQLRRARMMLRAPLAQMSLVLVNDETMSRLHQRFMHARRPTDVLTFPIDLDERGRSIRGEVYICVPEARRRARESGVRIGDELLLYALHGMLHLSGFDDRTQREFDRMHRMEDRILARLGVGPVFYQPASPLVAASNRRATSSRRGRTRRK